MIKIDMIVLVNIMNLKAITWNKKTYQEFIIYLKSISEDAYKEFSQKITFTKYEMLGIRLPKLRSIAKDISKGDYKSFLEVSQNKYYESVMIKLLVIANIKDLDECMSYFDEAISLIDNWALCDTFCNSLKIVAKNKEYFLNVIDDLIKSNKIYHIRVGLILLLCFYVEEEYLDLICKYLDSIKSDEYYVNMAEAWLLCEVFIKYEDFGLKYLENNQLNKFTINKTISKIRDSYRVSKSMKDYITKYRQ